jgi:hypothetical protein
MDPHLKEMHAIWVRIALLAPRQADVPSLDLRDEGRLGAGLSSRCNLTLPIGIAARSRFRESGCEGIG